MLELRAQWLEFHRKEVEKLSERLKVSSSPHVRGMATTTGIMLMVIIALLPATVFGWWHFGMPALVLILVTVASCVATEYIYETCMHKTITTSDLSAVVTGLLLALNLPSTAPWWIGVLGGVFAILMVKMLFGGLGQNFMNPALAARCFLLISFPMLMTDFNYDGLTSATPLALLKNGEAVNLTNMATGTIGGTIGETSAIALLAGGIFLVVIKLIDIRIPLCYIASFSVFVLLFGGRGFDLEFLMAHLCGGGLLLGAFFMATDYVTSPITKKGRVVFGVCLGLLTALFRIFGPSSEGVSYAIIFCNLLVPLIEKITLPKAFGKGGEKA